jgi:prepilin peptidase CpaA
LNLAADAPLWLAMILALLLIAGAVEDAARLRISNITCGLTAAAALVAMGVVGIEPAVWQNFAVFAALMAVGTVLFAAGKLGGGDVKLFAVTGLWFDLPSALTMLICVLLAGGVLALLVLGLRMFGWSEAARDRVVMLKAGSGIPYGVAIAAGSLIAVAVLRGQDALFAVG